MRPQVAREFVQELEQSAWVCQRPGVRREAWCPGEPLLFAVKVGAVGSPFLQSSLTLARGSLTRGRKWVGGSLTGEGVGGGPVTRGVGRGSLTGEKWVGDQ